MTTSHPPTDRTTVAISPIILGGHEYLDDGRSRAFNEDMAKATTPGYLFPGFGGEQRRELVRAALDLGITTFDVTTDSEKEAIARNLRELKVDRASVTLQTRPEAMLYTYDAFNRKLVEPGRLLSEVQRILDLMALRQLDILNIGIMADALIHDAGYLSLLRQVLDTLKDRQLIRWAAADTFSGEATYLRLIASGAFDTMNVNFGILDPGAMMRVIPAAHQAGLKVVAREAFAKGRLFAVAREAGLTDTDQVATLATKWLRQVNGVDAIILGARDANQLRLAVLAAENPSFSATEQALLQKLEADPAFRLLREKNTHAFLSQN